MSPSPPPASVPAPGGGLLLLASMTAASALKNDHRMDRCWLHGQSGDPLHALLCAAGYDLCWLMRAMLRLGLKALYLRPLVQLLQGMVRPIGALWGSRGHSWDGAVDRLGGMRRLGFGIS